MDGTGQKLESLLEELSKVNTQSRLSAAVEDVDKIIELLSTAREQVAESLDTHTASLTITKLQNPIKTAFDKVNDDLKAASSAHKKVGRSLDKNFPLRSLPTENDTMAGQLHLIDRAIAMHLLREGQFSVASTFINEADANDPPTAMVDLDEPMDENGDGKANGSATPARPRNQDCNVSSLQPQELQEKFTQMYQILQELKTQNLVPAIEWARDNSAELEARGSNLEFELSRLQYVWLFKGPAINGLPDDERNGRAGALAYARQHFGRFQARHLREIQELASAMVFAPNLSASPYGALFATDGAFADVSASFTREFCSLLGLSAESPLHLAVTAGALALPQLIKYQLATRAKRAEWTTLHEMPFETPLPQSMLFHNIFVCPVSKEQTTTSNPPMVIPCGHLLANETLKRLAKGNRFKCPYCPSEGHLKDARRVNL